MWILYPHFEQTIFLFLLRLFLYYVIVQNNSTINALYNLTSCTILSGAALHMRIT